MAGFAAGLTNAQLDAITTYAGNAAKLRIYGGSRPALGGTATTLLVEFTLGSPMASGASARVLTLTLPAATTGVVDGTATWARIVKSDGSTHVMDLSAGETGTEIILDTEEITNGGDVEVTSAVINGGNAS